jgi:hypothetical protein
MNEIVVYVCISTKLCFANLYHVQIMQILGGGMSTKMWEVTIEHAKTCVLTDKVHYYYPNNLNKTGVVFNVVGEVSGLISDKFVLVDDLSETEKVIMFSIKMFTCFPSQSIGSNWIIWLYIATFRRKHVQL